MSETVHDLAASYAFDAIDRQERLLFEAHLTGCAHCQHVLADFLEVVLGLSEGIEETPPVALRERLLAQVAQEPREQPERYGLGRRGGPAAHRAQRPGRRPTWLVGAAAAVVIGISAVTVSQWWSQQQDVPSVAQEVLDAPAARRFPGELEGATVTLVHSSQLQRSVLLGDDLTPAPQGRDYQLWYIGDDGAAVSGGLVPREEVAREEVLLKGQSDGAVAVCVTLEPVGGSEQPTSEPILAIPLQG